MCVCVFVCVCVCVCVFVFVCVLVCVWCVCGVCAVSYIAIPDPNQPQRGSLPVSRDAGSDPRWGWFGSGTETSIAIAMCVVCQIDHSVDKGAQF